MKVELAPRAIADLQSIRDFLLARNPQGAENVRHAIDATISFLADFPGLGRERPELEVRALGVAGYSYTVY
jgi:plasmid stabilization system protein ParE